MRAVNGRAGRARPALLLRGAVAAALAAALGTPAATVAAFSGMTAAGSEIAAAASFGLAQQAAAATCVSDTGSGGSCTDGTELDSPFGVAVSPDGRHVYAAAYLAQAVVVLATAPGGELTQVDCVSSDGTGGTCDQAGPLWGPEDVVVSPDGDHVYVADGAADAVITFRRDATSGALTQVGCVSETGAPAGCTDGRGLDLPNHVALSPDGASLYVSAHDSDGIAVFDRDLTTGALTQLPGTQGCITDSGSGGACTIGRGMDGAEEAVVSPDGAHVYMTNYYGDSVAVFARDETTGALTQPVGAEGCVSESGVGCTDGTGLDGADGLAISADGAHLYVAADGGDAVTWLVRDPATGALSQTAGTTCIAETGGACADGRGLDGAEGVEVTADGEHVAVASQTSDAVAVFARDDASGALTQLAGTAGCVSETGSGGACADGRALDGPFALAISPDDRWVYVAVRDGDGVTVLHRQSTTGVLTPLSPCVSETGGNCTDGAALGDPEGLATSPDGTSVYVASEDSDAVAVLSREPSTGILAPLPGTAGCVSETGNGGACTVGRALDGPKAVAVSPDGASVYVTAELSGAVAVFARDPTTGALTQLPGTAGCVSETGSGGACADGTALVDVEGITVSPDGASVYVASASSDAVAAFARDPATGALTQLAGTAGCVSETGSGGACADGTALDAAFDVQVAPDGDHVYATAGISGALVIFARDGSTGALTQLPGTAGCVSETGTGGLCADGVGLADPTGGLVVSPDGGHVYAAARTSDAVAAFARSPGTGALTQLPGTAACVSETGADGCTDGTALDHPEGIAISPDGEDVYVGAQMADAVAALARAADGSLAQRAAPRGCASLTGTAGACAVVMTLDNPDDVVVSPDGADVYAAVQANDAVTTLTRSR